MKAQFTQFTGSIPEHYEKGLVPYIFIDYGQDLADRVAALNPEKLLEIAAGTGVVTCMLQEALGDSTHMTVTDLNPEMLEVTQGKLGDFKNIKVQPADALALPFDDEVFDAVICQFGVMFFPDKATSYREVYRTLKSGGKYFFNVWDSFEHNAYARIAHEVICNTFPDNPPQFLQLPFGYYQTEAISDSLTDAGFINITVDVLRIEKIIPDTENFARGLVCGNPTAEEIKDRGDKDPEDVVSVLSEALKKEFGDNPGRMSLQSILFSVTKP